MIIKSEQCEKNAVLTVAELMAAAARTAPKTRGQDFIHTCVLTEDDLQTLGDRMEELAAEHELGFIKRDAENVRSSGALLALGASHNVRGLNEVCGYCGSKNCAECAAKGNACVYDSIDLGIAAASAVGVAALHHVDNRIMFSAGVGLKKMGVFDPSIEIMLGIPLSVSGKSPYFDRKPR